MGRVRFGLTCSVLLDPGYGSSPLKMQSAMKWCLMKRGWSLFNVIFNIMTFSKLTQWSLRKWHYGNY